MLRVKRLVAFEMTCYRKLLQISTQKITNEEVRPRLNITCSHLFKHLKKQNILYFGHIKRHCSLEKTVSARKVEVKRNRGRPRRGLVDDVKERLQISVVKSGGLVLERDAYRDGVRAATRRGTTFIADSAG